MKTAYSSLESVIELNKEAYYLALRQTQGTIRTQAPNWPPWLVFFLRSVAEQVRRLEKKIKHGRVTIGDAIKLTGVSRNALQQHSATWSSTDI